MEKHAGEWKHHGGCGATYWHLPFVLVVLVCCLLSSYAPLVEKKGNNDGNQAKNGSGWKRSAILRYGGGRYTYDTLGYEPAHVGLYHSTVAR